MAFKMKNPSMGKMAKAAGDSRVAMKMKTESAMKMKEKSPMEKELVGKQGNLPPELKAKIEAAPAKMRNRKGAVDTKSPMKATEGGTISYLGKKYKYANAEEKEALKTKLSATNKERKAKEAADKTARLKKLYAKSKTTDAKYSELRKTNTVESNLEADKLFKNTNSYSKTSVIGKEKLRLAAEKKAKLEAEKNRTSKDKSDSGLNMKKSAMKATDAELMAADKAKLNKGARQQDGKGKTDKERSATPKLDRSKARRNDPNDGVVSASEASGGMFMKKSPTKKLDDKNKRYREIKKIPKKEIKGVDVHSKISGLLLESNGKNVRQSMKIAGKTFVYKQNNDERTRDYIAKNQPKAKVPKDMPKGKKKETTKQFEKKAMRK